MNEELQSDFWCALDENGIKSGRTNMGTMSRHFYNEEGVKRWKEVAESSGYFISRASEKLTSKVAPDIMSSVPEGSELLLMGTSLKEAFAFASAGIGRIKNARVVDISQKIAQAQASALQELIPEISFKPLVRSFNEAASENTNTDSKKIVILPAVNIGNTPGILGKPVTENEQILNLLRSFRSSAHMLVAGYDTTRDEDLLHECYSGAEGDRFIVDGVVDLGLRVECPLSRDALERESIWSEQSDAYMHMVIVREEQKIYVGEQEIILPEGHPIYAAHSYKFNQPANDNKPNDLEIMARRTGWNPLSKPFTEDGRIAIQVFGLEAA